MALAVTAPLAAVALVALAALTSPPCLSRLRTRLGIRPNLESGYISAQKQGWDRTAAATARTLTDRDLCRAWVSSFDALQSATDWTTVERVVVLRQSYLDELERRHPEALVAWLESGARAAGSPDRYLGGSA